MIGDQGYMNIVVPPVKCDLQVIRFEPMISTWKVEVIPLNYTRIILYFYFLYFYNIKLYLNYKSYVTLK